MAELDVLEELLKAQGRSSNIRDDIVKVVELSEWDNGENIFELAPGGPIGDLKVNRSHEENDAILQKLAGKRNRRDGQRISEVDKNSKN